MDTHDTKIDDNAIALRLAGFRSKRFTNAQHEAFASALVRLTLQTMPRTEQEAISVMSTACVFIADVASSGDTGIDSLLTEERVSMWSHQQRASKRNAGTLKNNLCRLNRLLRVKVGLPSRLANSRAESADIALLREHVVVRSVQDLIRRDDRAAAALLAVCGTGSMPHEIVRGSFMRISGHATFVSGDSSMRDVLPQFHSLVSDVLSVTIDRAAYRRAVASLSASGTRITAEQLHATWEALLVATPVPAAELLTRTRLSRRAIDRAVGNVPQILHEKYDFIMRGAMR